MKAKPMSRNAQPKRVHVVKPGIGNSKGKRTIIQAMDGVLMV
jgi:hypothetical protein